ncbi:MAG: homoserine dehydrogenase [Alphaproteobacteria bacterium]|nr:homoserine dehydrogenase [Alphaproteobacteria bacterium]
MNHSTPVVLKFASSVLRRRSDLPRAVSEVYRHVRDGRKVVAIVSALDDETERLAADAAEIGAGLSSRHAAGFIALGEARAAYALAIACDHSGIAADVLEAKELRLSASGPFDDAWPTGVDPAGVMAALQHAEVVIAPGYVAVGPDGGLVLLGRGGADLTAIVLADALGAGEATFLTRVGGLFDRDPLTPERMPAPDAKRFDSVTWAGARALAGDPIQPKALSYAERREVALRLIAPAANDGTVIGPTGAPPRPAPTPAPVRIGVAGLGVVGEGAALRIIFEPSRYELAATLVSDAGKPRHRQIDPSKITTDIGAFLDSRPEVIIDAMSSGAAGLELIEAALARGISVATANKQAICDDLPRLEALAKANNARLGYSPSVGGGAPMLETARRAAAIGGVGDIHAVLNGTVNFILSQVAAGASFDAALAAAQAAGFAEADPSADLSGDDARAKGKILAYAAYGADPAAVTTDIEALDGPKADGFAREGGVWRQVARISRRGDGAHVEVRYEKVDGDPFMMSLFGEQNALRVETAGGLLVCRGRGAGRAPTVEAALADVGEIIRERSLSSGARP